MADVKVSALFELSSLAEEDTMIVNDYSETAEKVKAATIPNLRLAMLLPGIDNTNDIGSATKRIKDIYAKGNIILGGISQGKDKTRALHRIVYDIGDWNMDSTVFVNVIHGIDRTKMRRLSVYIRDDSGASHFPLPVIDGGTGAIVNAGITAVTATYVQIYRQTGCIFDSTSFDSLVYNRGWLTIEYVD
jgi:hypothetical protein